jgi:hypothetical protein
MPPSSLVTFSLFNEPSSIVAIVFGFVVLALVYLAPRSPLPSAESADTTLDAWPAP